MRDTYEKIIIGTILIAAIGLGCSVLFTILVQCAQDLEKVMGG